MNKDQLAELCTKLQRLQADAHEAASKAEYARHNANEAAEAARAACESVAECLAMVGAAYRNAEG